LAADLVKIIAPTAVGVLADMTAVDVLHHHFVADDAVPGQQVILGVRAAQLSAADGRMHVRVRPLIGQGDPALFGILMQQRP
jgi:hypothetical protein